MSLTDLLLEKTPELCEVIVRRNVRDVVAGKIAALIASGVLKVGDDLPSERHLAAALQVSRETVRGGIQILAAKRLLAVAQGAHTKVIADEVGPEFTGLRETRLINSYSVTDIHAARLLVERPVVARAAELIDDKTLAFLRDSLSSQLKAVDDPVRFLISDREFHLAIYRSCDNAALSDFVGNLYSYMMEYRRKAIAEPNAIQRSLSDHKAIVEALEQHDRDAVVRAFEVHIDHIYRTTITILGDADVTEEA